MQFRKQDAWRIEGDDVPLLKMFLGAILTFLIVTMVVWGISALVYYACKISYETTITENQEADILNGLEAPEREFLARQFILEIDEESGLVAKEEVGDLDKTISIICFITKIVYLVLGLTIPSIVASYIYNDKKDVHYYYADFPFRGLKKCIFLMLIWASFPVIIIDHFKMKKDLLEKERYEKEAAAAKQRLAEECKPYLQKGEQKMSEEECSNYALEQLIRRELTKNMQKPSDDEYKAYCHGRLIAIEYQQDRSLIETEESCKALENKLGRYGEEIQNIQKELGENRARIKKLKQQTKTIATPSDAELKHDWEELATMRGVTKIRVYEDKNKDGTCVLIKIDVCARIPYQGLIYDLGDYEISIALRNRFTPVFRAIQTRGSRHYQSAGEFCFGNKYDITNYLQEGNIVAAVALMIDKIHYVNPGDHRRVLNESNAIRDLQKIGHPA